MTLSVILLFHLVKMDIIINIASFVLAISILYSTLDILISFQTRSRSLSCYCEYCVLQTDTPFSDHVLFCILISTCTNS